MPKQGQQNFSATPSGGGQSINFQLSQSGLEEIIEHLAKTGMITRSSLKAACDAKLAKFQLWSRKPASDAKSPGKARTQKEKVAPVQQAPTGRKAQLKEARKSAVRKIAVGLSLIDEKSEGTYTFDNDACIQQWNGACRNHFGEGFFKRDENKKFLVSDRKETIIKTLSDFGLTDLEKSASAVVFPQYNLSAPKTAEVKPEGKEGGRTATLTPSNPSSASGSQAAEGAGNAGP